MQPRAELTCFKDSELHQVQSGGQQDDDVTGGSSKERREQKSRASRSRICILQHQSARGPTRLVMAVCWGCERTGRRGDWIVDAVSPGPKGARRGDQKEPM